MDKKAQDVLDIGGGLGMPMSFFDKKCGFRLRVNADITLSRLKEAEKRGTHDEYVLCDALVLPFKRQSFDTVLCLNMMEHLGKEEGIKFLSGLDEMARKQIILVVPINSELTSIPLEKRVAADPGHISSWCPRELKGLGYTVRGKRFSTH